MDEDVILRARLDAIEEALERLESREAVPTRCLLVQPLAGGGAGDRYHRCQVLRLSGEEVAGAVATRTPAGGEVVAASMGGSAPSTTRPSLAVQVGDRWVLVNL